MKLWMSGEIDADVYKFFSATRQSVEKAVNKNLAQVVLPDGAFEKWAVIPILCAEEDPDYNEVVKKHVKRRVLEFRLKIDHDLFLRGTDVQRTALVLDMLNRSIDLMPKVDVQDRQRAGLKAAVAAAKAELT